MNRRAFLLGAIATPIATKVDAVSAALRPDSYGLSPSAMALDNLKAFQEYHNKLWHMIMNTKEYWRSYEDMLLYGQSTFDPYKAIAEIEALDRPGEPCDASIAGRDQIG